MTTPIHLNATDCDATLQALCQSGQIQAHRDIAHLSIKEQQSLQRLRLRPCHTDKSLYLNLYDRLFRHVSLLLLAADYALTQKQPHQTLYTLATCWQSPPSVQHMIRERHRLKKTNDQLTCPDASHTLCLLLALFDAKDAQACQTLLPDPF